MKLIDALTTVRTAPVDAAPYRVYVACGFTPLHLATFVAAYAQLALPDRRVVTTTGLYGVLADTLETAALDDVHAFAVVVEWADLDPRLGLRSVGGWSPDLSELVANAQAMARRIAAALARIAARVPIAIALPSLALPPAFLTRRAHAGAAEVELRAAVAQLAVAAAQVRNVRIASEQYLAERSPLAGRGDPRADLLHGFPYTLAHASVLGEQLATLLRPPARKKGLITDLDDTLWRGIVGDVGPEHVSWGLDHKSQLHGLYQQLVRSLADAGVFVAVASKNDARVVDQAFARPDLVLPRDKIFPLEVHWEAKSESVRRILKAWNIGADAVIVVDDSAMELAEIAAAHPGIDCRRFPTLDDPAGLELLRELRDAFGTERVTDEDLLRQRSVQQRASAAGEPDDAFVAAPETFLAAAHAELTINFAKTPADERAFELINKTNQFNLNGRRIEEASFWASLARPETFLAVTSYTDKFGPLGKIAVVVGRLEPGRLRVDHWVLSCRAFARRVEHASLGQLFTAFDVGEIVFDYAETARNGPTQQLFASLLGEVRTGELVVTRETFAAACPTLYHQVKITR